MFVVAFRVRASVVPTGHGGNKKKNVYAGDALFGANNVFFFLEWAGGSSVPLRIWMLLFFLSRHVRKRFVVMPCRVVRRRAAVSSVCVAGLVYNSAWHLFRIRTWWYFFVRYGGSCVPFYFTLCAPFSLISYRGCHTFNSDTRSPSRQP